MFTPDTPLVEMNSPDIVRRFFEKISLLGISKVKDILLIDFYDIELLAIHVKMFAENSDAAKRFRKAYVSWAKRHKIGPRMEAETNRFRKVVAKLGYELSERGFYLNRDFLRISYPIHSNGIEVSVHIVFTSEDNPNNLSEQVMSEIYTDLMGLGEEYPFILYFSLYGSKKFQQIK